MTVPLLTVVTVTRNNRHGLSRTLRSVEGQDDFAHLELIVVDGASSDGTEESLQALTASNTSWVSEPDNGIYDAMNKGAGMARGDYLLFLNAGDAFYDAGSATALLAGLARHPLWVVARAARDDLPGQPLIANQPHVWYRHALGLQPHCHQSTVFSRRVFLDCGGYDERFGFVSDFDLIFRFGALQAPEEVNDIVALYEGGGHSAQRTTEVARKLHQVRVERLELEGAAKYLDDAWTLYREIRHFGTVLRRQGLRAAIRNAMPARGSSH